MQSMLKITFQAVIPVLAAVAAFSTLAAGGLSLPIALKLSAWPQWMILASLVFTYSSIGYWAAEKIYPKKQPLSSEPRSAA